MLIKKVVPFFATILLRPVLNETPTQFTQGEKKIHINFRTSYELYKKKALQFGIENSLQLRIYTFAYMYFISIVRYAQQKLNIL